MFRAKSQASSYTPKVLGLPRKWFLAAVGLLCLMILIIGLSVGLTHKHKSSTFLPLPSNANQIYTGDATYYAPGLGACGVTSKDSDHIVAISHTLWDSQSKSSNPNDNPLCGLKIRVMRYRPNNEAYLIGAGGSDAPGGRNVSVDVTVVDRCTGCKSQDLDFSLSAFEVLAAEAMGRVKMEWTWLK